MICPASLRYLTGVSSLTRAGIGISGEIDRGVKERKGSVMCCNESGTVLIATSPVEPLSSS